MSKTWIQSYPSSKKWDLLNLTPDDIPAGDVAWHLSQVNRYTGGTRLPLSVAEHCVRVSRAVEACMRAANDRPDMERTQPVYTPEEIRLAALAGLVHDAAEAMTQDLSNPAKQALRVIFYEQVRQILEVRGHQVDAAVELRMPSPYDVLEERLQPIFAKRFGAPWPWPPIVKHFDLVLLATEKRDLLGAPPERWDLPDEVRPLDGTITAWLPETARALWLERLLQLGGNL